MTNSWRCFTTKWDTECIFLFVSFVYVLREPIQRKITDVMLLSMMFHSRWLLDDFLAPLVSTCPENENDQKTRKTAKDAQRLPQTLQELQRAGEIPRETDTSPETAKAKLVVVSVLGSHKLLTPLVGQAATQWHLFPSLNARLCKRGCGHELLSCHAVST